MNKYEALFDAITKQTKAGELKWKQLRRQANSDLIFNPGLVFRQFEAKFSKAGEDFNLLLVEKKYDDPEHDYAFQRYFPELLVVDEAGELVATLTDSLIERTALSRLVDMVEVRSDKANKLFGPDE